jgi:hypothetical protein
MKKSSKSQSKPKSKPKSKPRRACKLVVLPGGKKDKSHGPYYVPGTAEGPHFLCEKDENGGPPRAVVFAFTSEERMHEFCRDTGLACEHWGVTPKDETEEKIAKKASKAIDREVSVVVDPRDRKMTLARAGIVEPVEVTGLLPEISPFLVPYEAEGLRPDSFRFWVPLHRDKKGESLVTLSDEATSKDIYLPVFESREAAERILRRASAPYDDVVEIRDPDAEAADIVAGIGGAVVRIAHGESLTCHKSRLPASCRWRERVLPPRRSEGTSTPLSSGAYVLPYGPDGLVMTVRMRATYELFVPVFKSEEEAISFFAGEAALPKAFQVIPHLPTLLQRMPRVTASGRAVRFVTGIEKVDGGRVRYSVIEWGN